MLLVRFPSLYVCLHSIDDDDDDGGGGLCGDGQGLFVCALSTTFCCLVLCFMYVHVSMYSSCMCMCVWSSKLTRATLT